MGFLRASLERMMSWSWCKERGSRREMRSPRDLNSVSGVFSARGRRLSKCAGSVCGDRLTCCRSIMTQIPDTQRQQTNCVCSLLGALPHSWLMKVCSVQSRCHNCRDVGGGYRRGRRLSTYWIKSSLLGVIRPPDGQLGCARRVVSRSLSTSLGHNGPCVLLIVPGEGKRVSGFLTKGDPKPAGTQIEDWGTLDGGGNSSQIV